MTRTGDAQPLGVAVVGCGLIGTRRAQAALAHPATQLRMLVDTDLDRARAASAGCDVSADWKDAVGRADVDIVVVSTPNGHLCEVVTAALEGGSHVLMEKPMGRNRAEAEAMRAAAQASGQLLQVGFNHRYHPALAKAAEMVRGGAIGPLISLRARYGHGGRPGLEKEWRSHPELGGGGELLDQGVHVVDLMQWLAGPANEVFAVTQTAVWPISPMEDNAYAILRFDDGAVGHMHVSMTQWKNLFSFEVFGERGSVTVEGLGGSYGTERLIHAERAMAGGAPRMSEELFEGADVSWMDQWETFIEGVVTGTSTGPSAEEGVGVMRTVEALYASARTGAVVRP